VSGVLFRWAGSKARALPQLFASMPLHRNASGPLFSQGKPYKRWVEPFVGGASVALEAMRRQLADEYVLSDALPDLVCTLGELQHPISSLLAGLSAIAGEPIGTQKQRYLQARSGVPMLSQNRALRFLRLQACSFNGLWRESVKSGFNVPFARAASFDLDALSEANSLFSRNKAVFVCQRFEETIRQASAGDILYADPPYLGAHSDYTAAGFTRADHGRLRDCLEAAAERGAEVWLSGSATPETRECYEAYVLDWHELRVPRSISCKGKTRGTKTELLMRIGSALAVATRTSTGARP
jgi:DNA adenine methylase